MEALASSAACALMIGVIAVALLGRPTLRRRGTAEGSNAELSQLRSEVAELREQRRDRELQP